jgi:tRNA(Ile)-lysidine synthase
LGVIEQFLNHIKRHKLCKTSDKILLAVSGGIDSMVMLYLFKEARIDFAVAHCNFQLRGIESDGDQKFVETICNEFGVSYHSKNFDTVSIAEQQKQSIQVIARNLRYEFFEQMRISFGYDFVATAHSLSDSFETVLLNLVRGSGIDGIQGIPLKNKAVIRPMLFATRDEIRQYAMVKSIQWREDSSNATDHYQRNFVRHHVVPLLRQLNPNLEHTFQDTSGRLRTGNDLRQKALSGLRDQFILTRNGSLYIQQAFILGSEYAEALLWEFIKEYDFNYDQCKQIVLDHQSGKQFDTSHYRLTADREFFILSPKVERDQKSVSIDLENQVVLLNGTELRLTSTSIADFRLQKSSDLAQLDLDKLTFPLTWRYWQAGDSLVPLGMTGEKKVSDLLIDLKTSRPDKENVTVIESAGTIVWVVGFRIHDAFKIGENTQRTLTIAVLKHNL